MSLFVTDEELIARLGLPKGTRGTRVLVELTKQRNRAPRAELRGKNLACFCPLDQPCHADVLLEIANKD